jgi:hypothetical protein
MENLMEGKHSMSKGIELLLARRKTNPEEFVGRLDTFELSRWNNFLRTFDINLDQPNTYPVGENGKNFTKEVIDRLLTQSDLRPSALLVTATITERLLKISEDTLSKAYSARTSELTEIFK